ncbi:CBO0543 family protein [Bacillus rubiinfantis]|uniref:CBO0543 family protein n=1 Tax=Bacillus rubiinfantis TaxID=1499680 RepID=UPI001FE33DC6|nr:CBO0543 family protein [Bacillus rubiinfantis]
MNTVKHSNDSRLQPWRKRRLTFWDRRYLPAALLAGLVGTYSDLLFVGMGLYEFPLRPFPQIFPINIVFTLGVLPLCVMIFLYYGSQVTKWGKLGIILFISLLVPILEKLAEQLGYFVHSENWQHIYSFFGYLFFLIWIDHFNHWVKSRKSRA